MKYIDLLFDSKEQDDRTARSARMIAYTEEEIEQLLNQEPITTTNPNEYRSNIP